MKWNLLGQKYRESAYRGLAFDGSIPVSLLKLIRPVAAIDGNGPHPFYSPAIRLNSTDDIIAVYEDNFELVSFLHLLKSGSDRILTR